MTKVPKYWTSAKRYLSRKDKTISKLIMNYKSPSEKILTTRKDIFLEYLPEGEANINRDPSYNKDLFEQKKIDDSWSTDFIRFEWDKIY